MKKIRLLLLLCLLPVLCACSAGAYGYTETRMPVTPALDPELDYGGRRVVLLTTASPDAAEDLAGGERLSDTVEDAILTRNRDVELELGVLLETVSVPSVSTALRQDVTAGTGAYDIALGQVGTDAAAASENLLYNLNNISSLDLTAPCWDSAFCGAAQIYGRLYLATGALSLSMTRGAYVTFANSAVLGGKLTDRLTALVSSGNFTVDRQREIASEAYVDLNGNSMQDAGDSYGLGSNRAGCADAYWGAFALNLTSHGPDGGLVLSDGSARVISAYEKLYALLLGDPGTRICDGTEGLYELHDLFAGGQLAMATLPLSAAEDAAFPSTTLVLPLPKYDEAQEQYHTFSGTGYSVSMIPRGASDPVCSGAVLQALCARSARDVLPLYYNAVTAGRYVTDESVASYLTLALGSPHTDAAWIYAGQLEGAVTGILSAQLESGATENVSACAICQKALARLLPSFNSAYMSLTY